MSKTIIKLNNLRTDDPYKVGDVIQTDLGLRIIVRGYNEYNLLDTDFIRRHGVHDLLDINKLYRSVEFVTHLEFDKDLT